MKKKVDKDLLVNTMILSNSLHDNIEIMVDNGWFGQDLKMFAKNFGQKLLRFTKQVYSGVDDKRMMELCDELDLEMELFGEIHKLSTERKKVVLAELKNTYSPTLEQVIEKAKPNMDKIKDVDAHIESIGKI